MSLLAPSAAPSRSGAPWPGSGSVEDVDADSLALLERVRAFESTRLPPTEWTHAMHLTVALVYVRERGPSGALRAMRDGIVRYQTSLGHTTRYHETITRAWLSIVVRFDEMVGPQTLAQAVARLVALCGDARLLFHYYSPAALFSPAARGGWVPPDLRPLGHVEFAD